LAVRVLNPPVARSHEWVAKSMAFSYDAFSGCSAADCGLAGDAFRGEGNGVAWGSGVAGPAEYGTAMGVSDTTGGIE